MKPKADPAYTRQHQSRLIADDHAPLLREFIDLHHPMVLLADRIDWDSLGYERAVASLGEMDSPEWKAFFESNKK